MAYLYGDRDQMGLFPQSIEEYVPEDAPVRAYDAFVEALDLEALGIGWDECQVGPPEYDPKAMLKLLLYGYSYGVRSSRKLEREAHYNVSFIWLLGGLKPDHKTIAEFRRRNKGALKGVLKQCARLCLKLGLIEGNTLFIDSMKIRGNASLKATWTKERCERAIEAMDERIGELLAECERIDEEEGGHPSLVKLAEEYQNQEVLRRKVREIVAELEASGAKSLNRTDKECTRIHGLEGTQAGYLTELVVDEKEGLIVSSDVVAENNDRNQFAGQVEKAHDVLGKKCGVACADSGYWKTEELEKVDQQDIRVVVPSQRQVAQRERDPFDKWQFRYEREGDYYTCPEGKVLRCFAKTKKVRHYGLEDRRTCGKCRHFGVCTKSKRGRVVVRGVKEEVMAKLEQQYRSSQEIYKRRQARAELPFGHIKRNLGMQAFLLRGLEGVKAEMALVASCFNLRRMMTIKGIPQLITVLGG